MGNTSFKSGDRVYYNGTYCSIISLFNDSAFVYSEYENYKFKSIKDLVCSYEPKTDLFFKPFMQSIGGCYRLSQSNTKIWEERKFDVANLSDLTSGFSYSADSASTYSDNVLATMKHKMHSYLRLAKRVMDKDSERAQKLCAKAENIQKAIENIELMGILDD